jgi:hypothetical protein
MPDGLESWFKARARETGQSVNALMVAALEEFRNRQDGATAPAPAKAAGATTRTQARQPARKTPAAPGPALGPCKHTRALKGWCNECKTGGHF